MARGSRLGPPPPGDPVPTSITVSPCPAVAKQSLGVLGADPRFAQQTLGHTVLFFQYLR